MLWEPVTEEGTPPVSDCDVVIGRDPDTRVTHSAESVAARLRETGIAGGLVSSLRAMHFDVTTENDEALAATSCALLASGTLDPRDPLDGRRELERLVERDVRAVRLCPSLGRVPPSIPGLRQLARQLAGHGLVTLVDGDVREMWTVFADLGATVVFLYTHFYQLGDFVVAAEEEPGFHTSTRLLGNPDGLELVSDAVGARRLVFGTGAPRFEPAAGLLRVRKARLRAPEVALVAGGNLRRLLGYNQ